MAAGAVLATVPVGAVAGQTHAAGHVARPSLRPIGPRTGALDALRHLTRPTTTVQMLAWRATEMRARAALGDGTLGDGILGDGTAVTAAGQVAVEMPVATGGNGDDVLVLTLPDTRPSSLSLRSGRTGATKWRVQLADAWTFDIARLGAARRPAAVVYQTAFTGASDPFGLQDTGEQDNSVVAIDLATGKTYWTSSIIHGTYSVNPASFNEAAAMYPAGILHDRGGDRVLGTLVSQSWGDVDGVLQQQAVVFDGVTGAMTPLGAPTAGDAYSYVAAAGDVNGDGLSDVIQLLSGEASVVVESGASGLPLWAKNMLPALTVDAFGVPDLDGDHRVDVVLFHDAGTSGGDGVIAAYAGATGTALWSRTGDFAVPIGAVAGRNVVAVFASGFDGMSIEAVAGAGTTLWRRTVTVPDVGDGGWAMGFGSAGDVDSDRVDDLVVDVMYAGTAATGHFETIVSGRSGIARKGAPIGWPVGGSLDGHGDDFVAFAPGRSVATFTGYDGNTRRRLWQLTLPIAGARMSVVDANAVALAGRGHSLVLDVWDGNRTDLLAVGGRSGRRLWTQNV